ncbi:hypothetical protein Y032_0059g2957 [Ancylostoma ceylanicum]|uniref:Core-2/I-Branching enzyme n=1 Tax=Ancylostoma ceylanicum TaxID=53326 RepID=A0A016U3S8_9BILA|nr:hypothetical protein Y032_0059g2957 [Ancylostoma ceylanicum]
MKAGSTIAKLVPVRRTLPQKIFFTIVALTTLTLYYSGYRPVDFMKKSRLSFHKRPETSHLDCGRILRGDMAYIASVATHRPVLRSSEQISSCEEIRSRVVGSAPMKTLAFGVAYARIVYRDYEFLEDELRSSYHSQNYFCYSIDRKANKNFHSRIEKLASCLPNVLITAGE